jgi:hypothetical protein
MKITANQPYVVEFPMLGSDPRRVHTNVVGHIGSGLAHRLYVGADGKRVKHGAMRLTQRRERATHIAVCRFLVPSSAAPLVQEVRRIRPDEWAEREARRADPSKAADFCVLALRKSKLYDRGAEVFRFGDREVSEAAYRDAITGLPELSAEPPHFNGPGCAEDLVAVGSGVLRVTQELLGTPIGAVCAVTHETIEEYRNL